MTPNFGDPVKKGNIYIQAMEMQQAFYSPYLKKVKRL